MYKCVILIREDLKMSKGKVIAQCGHAIVNMMKHSNKQKQRKWIQNGEKIVTLKISKLNDIKEIVNEINSKIFTHIVVDAGRTEIEPNTETVCIIGPEEENIINYYTSHLKLY